MNLKENNSTTILIKGDIITTEKQFEKKTKLTSNFKKHFNEFLDSFKEINTILSSYSDKNLILIEDINKSFSSFVRESENIDTENSVNYTNIERQLKRLSNFFSKLLLPTNKNRAFIVKIDNYCSELYSTTRFLHDVVNIEKKSPKDENQASSSSKEYQRLANEFGNRFPRFDGFKIEIKSYPGEFDIQLITTNQTSTARMLRETVHKINQELIEYLEWELQKLNQTTTCTITLSNNSITVEFSSDGDDESEDDEEYEEEND